MTVDDPRVEIERLRQENDRLRAENATLRPLLAQLRHDYAAALRRCESCEYHPHRMPPDQEHG